MLRYVIHKHIEEEEEEKGRDKHHHEPGEMAARARLLQADTMCIVWKLAE